MQYFSQKKFYEIYANFVETTFHKNRLILQYKHSVMEH